MAPKPPRDTDAAEHDGLQRAHGVYYLIMHSDTIVRRRGGLRRTFLRDASARQLTREPCPRDYLALYRTAVLRGMGSALS